MNFSLLSANVNGFTPFSAAIEALGWTLVHLVWQGAAVALLLWSCLVLARKASPQLRYLLGCAALSLMCLGVASTLARQLATSQHPIAIGSSIKPIEFDPPRPETTQTIEIPSIGAEFVIARPLPQKGVETAAVAYPAVPFAPAKNLTQSPTASASRLEALTALLRLLLPWLVGFWALGVGCLSLRLAVGWRVVRRLRSQGSETQDSIWIDRFARMRQSLGISSPVPLLCSDTATVPMVIGWLKPVVLVPAGLLTGLSAAQLEALLAHELAHVRRHDYLVNLLQNAVETLLFYHPAVWYVSGQIRKEREHCCDDAACAACGSTLEYAQALATLAKGHLRPTLGVAASGSPLVERIRRLATGGGEASASRGGSWPAAALVLLLIAALCVRSAGPPRAAEADQKVNQGANAKSPRGNETMSFRGRLRDTNGASVANANIYLTIPAIGASWTEGPTVVAQTQSNMSGQFEVSTIASRIGWKADRPSIRLAIWAYKPGLVVGHQEIKLEGSEGPFRIESVEIEMAAESPLEIRLHNPDGSPCADATVTPSAARFPVEHFVRLPAVIQNRLRTRTDRAGRATVLGFADDEVNELTFQSSGSGVQCYDLLSRQNTPVAETSPLQVTLRKTVRLEGRLIPPSGSVPELSGVKLLVSTRCNRGTNPDRSDAWHEQIPIRPDRDGRFVIVKIAEGNVRIDLADAPEDFGFRCERQQKPFVVVPARTLTIDIPLWKATRVRRIVRDSRTKLPVARVYVSLERGSESVNNPTDPNGEFLAWIQPGVPYDTSCILPYGYVAWKSASTEPILVSAKAELQELPPIELVRGRKIEGTVVNASGQPMADVRVGASWGPMEEDPVTRKSQAVQARRWTVTDSQGHFRMDGIAADSEIALTPVRAQVILCKSVRMAAGDYGSARLQADPFDFTTLSGRIVATDGMPLAGVRFTIELRRSNQVYAAFQDVTDGAGRIHAPPHFPREFEYRFTVRSYSQEVASSAWMRPLSFGNQFPDLVVDQSKLAAQSRILANEVVATVNGEPILASEVFERAWTAALTPGGPSLFVANQELKAGQISEGEFRKVQDAAIHTFLKDYIKTVVMAQALLSTWSKPQKEQLIKSIAEEFEGHVKSLQRQWNVSARDQLEAKLSEQGISLASLRKRFERAVLADEYIKIRLRSGWDSDRQQRLAYFKAHADKFRISTKVRWQLLEIGFDKRGRDAARQRIEEAFEKLHQQGLMISTKPSRSNGPDTNVDDIRQGKIFESVVRQYSDGPRAEMGGWQPVTCLDSVADEWTVHLLGDLPEGKISPIIETQSSFRILRLCYRLPARQKSFREVEESIAQTLRDQARKPIVEQGLSEAVIETTLQSPAESRGKN